MNALGVKSSFFSAHTYYSGDMHRDVTMGEKRFNQISRALTAMGEGQCVSSYLDTADSRVGKGGY